MSQMAAETKEINGHVYEMYMLPPMISHSLLMDFMQVVAPSLGNIVEVLFSGRGEEIENVEIPRGFLAESFEKLFRKENKEIVERMISTFKSMTHVDGKELSKNFDLHFRGELKELYEWLFWGISVQWGKLLSGSVSGIVGQSVEKMRAVFQSPST